jgi:hypothetical protein
MTLPGFTAEASARPALGTYRSVPGGSLPAPTTVEAQFRRPFLYFMCSALEQRCAARCHGDPICLAECAYRFNLCTFYDEPQVLARTGHVEAQIGGGLEPSLGAAAFAKGCGRCEPDPESPLGGTKFCCDPKVHDHCEPIEVACRPTGGGGGGGGGGGDQGPACGSGHCAVGGQCCGGGNCCGAGKHCCSDGDGCCKNGDVCRSFLGWHFCSPF